MVIILDSELKKELEKEETFDFKEEIDLEDKENLVDDELKDMLTEEKTKIFSDDLRFAMTFLNCFDVIKLNIEKINNEKFNGWLKKFEETEKYLRNQFKNYEKGEGYGDWIIQERIKNEVSSNREKIIKFLEVFIRIFIED